MPETMLKDVFGFDHFRPMQKKIIESILAGRHNFVLMPTGGGKSLCYQIPALLKTGVGIVVSPLISLMRDQVEALRANGVSAAYYNSSLNAQEARSVLAKLHAGELSLLYIAPERLMSEAFLARLDEIDIALFAIDEAHCVSQWGPDFRPEYLQLARLRELFPTLPLAAFTATADRQTRTDIRRVLGLETADFHLASFNRPNIRYTVLEKRQPMQQLQQFLSQHEDEAGIVYCMTRKRVDEVSAKLNAQGLSAVPYHAGMGAAARQKNQDDFQKDNINIVVATVAFGMGIDKPNVRFVVHYDMPKNIEAYYQETGRAGRDDLVSEALLLYGLGDIAIARGLIERNGNEQQRRIEIQKLNAMASFCEAQTCRRRVLLNYFDEALEKNCGNCDICLNPPETIDATEDARKALSCVYRVNQRFGVGYVVDVLRGAKIKRIQDFRHDQLSTYGLGAHLSRDEWHNIFRQLIHQGYIEKDIANYSVLKLTEKSRPLLRGEAKIKLAKMREKPAKKKSTKKKQKKLLTNLSYDEALFESLRQVRKQLADAGGVPPFVVFSDASLIEMAAFKPTTSDAFLAINGVGQHKLEKYGDPFMQAIAQA
jgi:ATP-dependent DNA helicase RecQ